MSLKQHLLETETLPRLQAKKARVDRIRRKMEEITKSEGGVTSPNSVLQAWHVVQIRLAPKDVENIELAAAIGVRPQAITDARLGRTHKQIIIPEGKTWLGLDAIKERSQPRD